MSERYYHKLVRDNIPDIIENSGKRAMTRQLSANEYKTELDRKLLEETNEYLAEGNTEELADIVEVVYAILDFRGIDPNSFEELRLKKRQKNGGFAKRCYLESVISD